VSRPARTRGTTFSAVATIAVLTAFLALAPFAASDPVAGGTTVRGSEGEVSGIFNTMTRNLYIGADLEPAFGAPSLEAFVAASGQIVREVDENDFPTRAEGLAQEISEENPDLVGLQEVALWREGEPTLGVFPPSATTDRYNFLDELLAELSAAGSEYEVVISQNEADIEAPADENGIPGDGPKGIDNAEINIRLTVRDAILARSGAGVQTANPGAGHFANLLPVSILGFVEVPVTRGWTATDARVGAGPWFRFVSTHLESSDPPTQVPSYRAKQAAELVAPGGPATSGLPVVLVGDLNSDDDTVDPGNRQAYETLLAAGMVERSTDIPLSCCLKSSLLAEGAGGHLEDFDHQVDHVMTRDPAQVTLKSSAVTGLMPVNGFWDSDHAGLFSSLEIVAEPEPEPSPAPAPLQAPSQPAPAAGRAVLATSAARVKGGKALLKLRCRGGGPCKGVVKLLAKRKLIGKSRFSIAAGKTKVVKVKLRGKGKALVRKAGKHGFKAKVAGTGVKRRTILLKP
jgi:endonuclease/exonuclease/phosphatase family metal-dependent hydrolase